MRKFLPLILIAIVLLITVLFVGKQTGYLNFAGGNSEPIELSETDPNLKYSGSWQKVKTPLARGGYYVQSKTPGDSVTLETGDIFAFKFNLIKNKNAGIANIYVDDRYVGSIDTYSPKKDYRPTDDFQLVTFDSNKQIHKITLVVSNTKNPASSGNYIMLDGLELINLPIPQTAPIPQPIGSLIEQVTGKKLNATQYRLAVTYLWDGQNGPAKISAVGQDQYGNTVATSTPAKAVANKLHTAGITVKVTDQTKTLNSFHVCIIDKYSKETYCVQQYLPLPNPSPTPKPSVTKKPRSTPAPRPSTAPISPYPTDILP